MSGIGWRVPARKACSAATTCAPSPTAAATRLMDFARTSPMAKTPRRLVSSGMAIAAGILAGQHETLWIERNA